MLKTAEMNVAGRNAKVRKAIVFIAALSDCVARPIWSDRPVSYGKCRLDYGWCPRSSAALPHLDRTSMMTKRPTLPTPELRAPESEQDSCLICGEELSLSVLQEYLAAYIEDIALFVLPNTDKDEAGDSNASVQVAKLESKGKSKDTESQASSLGFSEAGDYGQTPAEFTKLLTSKEAGYISKFSLWSITEED
ncbi:C2H2 type zinc finger domain protein [Ilyonectria robusta]